MDFLKYKIISTEIICSIYLSQINIHIGMAIIICISRFYLFLQSTLAVFVIKISVDCNVWRNYLIFIPSFRIIWKITSQSTAPAC